VSAAALRLRRDRLIVDHLPLVRSVARCFASEVADFDDLVQVGTIGLIKAVDRYDPAYGVCLAAYARPTVVGEIQRHLRDTAPVVRPPRRLHELQGKLQRTQAELTMRLGRPATSRELADAVGASQAEADAAGRVDEARRPLPLEAVDEPEAPDPFRASDDRLILAECSRTLDERRRLILHLRFFAGLTLREIAAETRISPAHASRLLNDALAGLRRELERRDITLSEIVVPVSESYTRSHAATRTAR
jgi:RNA polymerase sigma-B factor